jgi:hypothetical protein
LNRRRSSLGRTAALLGFVLFAATLALVLETVPSSTASATSRAAHRTCESPPRARDEPSGALPLKPHQFRGWSRSYCADFAGTQLPRGWDRFRGVPKGDPTGLWAASHVTVKGGVLELSTWRDPAHAMRWTSGGVCQCGRSYRYGAFYVRSRLTGGGTSDVELLWPKDNRWPPELDFFESWKAGNQNTYTDHYTVDDHIKQGWLRANLTRWHTWGVMWQPHRIEFVIEWGANHWEVWGRITSRSAIPRVPMTLDLQQQVWCSILPACPTSPSAMLVDWVVEYVPHLRH